MRRAPAIAFAFLVATAAAAQEFSARALLSFEHYDYGLAARDGFRQTYDLGLDRALTGNSRLRIFFRGDDFRGTAGANVRQKSGTRQLQPGGELTINTLNTVAMFRSEVFDTQSQTGNQHYDRTLQRSSAIVNWTPVNLPSVRLIAQRNDTNDESTRLRDDSAAGAIEYTWKRLATALSENLTRSSDVRAGYSRTSTMSNASVGYANTTFGGRLTTSFDVSGQQLTFDERGIAGTTTSVPTPVPPAHALYVVDDTPADTRDHQLIETPALIDSDINTSTTISLGPTSVSFQNLILDIGHIDRVDEMRIVVRDELHNPLRNGGGPVAWDVYISVDGQTWTLVSSQTTFNTGLSYYSATFTQQNTRWIKVVNFGVNADPTFVTELQAFYHTQIAAGQTRRGSQTGYTASASITGSPTKRLNLGYTSMYTSITQNLSATGRTSTTDLEHSLTAQYVLTRSLAVRGLYNYRNIHNFTGRTGDYLQGYSALLDYTPTPQLRLSLESTSQRERLDGTPFLLDTRAVHATAYVVRALQVGFDAGEQRQAITGDARGGTRTFVNLSAHAQLTPRLRMLLNGTMQQTRSDSTDPVVQLLGPQRDDRLTDEFIWRAGRALQVGARFGWVSGVAVSAFTKRYHVDWFPFSDGAVSVTTSYDDDIDPMLNRRAKRLLFNPRWVMNRFAVFDINYTSVSSTTGTITNQQRSVFATLTLTK